MQNKRKQVSCLKQSCKICKFCLKQSQVLRASGGTPLPKLPLCTPPPPRGGLQRQYPYIGYTMQLDTAKISLSV